MLCREQTLVKHLTNAQHLHPLRCKCWHCELCAEDRQKDLRGLARRGEPNRFLTLTIRPQAAKTFDQHAQMLAHAFLLLRRRLKRKYKLKKLAFLAVFERHKSGFPHLHILLRTRYFPQSIISDIMGRLIDSPHVDIRHVTDKGRIAYYVAKYVAKCPTKFEGCKRYWRSQDYELAERKYQKPEPDPDVWWSRVTRAPLYCVRFALAEGRTVTHDGSKWIVSGGPAPPW